MSDHFVTFCIKGLKVHYSKGLRLNKIYDSACEYSKNVLHFFSASCTCAYRGLRNVSFLENFVYVLIEWSLLSYLFLSQLL